MSPDQPGTEALRPLQPAVRTVWRIKAGLFWTLVFAGTAVAEVVWLLGGSGPVPFGWPMAFVFLFGTTWTILQPHLRYRFWRFDLRSEELYLERGIITRVRTIVPLRRIQHLDVSQDVLEREFDLGELIVHTAGARSSEVVLPGLDYEEAQKLRDTLNRYILEDAV
ncbi:MAG: PH domain-containing protein [Rhodothermales bacterium]